MSNQTSKVIASDKGQFKNAVPAIVCLVIINIIIWILGAGLVLLVGFIDAVATPESEFVLAVFEMVLESLALIMFYPMPIIISIAFILVIIAKIIDKATLTEVGIFGRNTNLRKFDLTFDKIVAVCQIKKSVVITYVNDKGNQKMMRVYLTQVKDFADACNAQLNAYKAANAQGA